MVNTGMPATLPRRPEPLIFHIMADNSNLQSNQAANAVPVSPFKEILTIEEAAEFLSVSKSDLYKPDERTGDSSLQANRQTVLLQAKRT